ncbi:MAG: biotin--[acetyl-CoA-carboxylase] ligase, partial [candidate division Zixibacteria bacterium]|nr:biotin--[acetyl-CoA-carboxylase] ligase [candidate division Zixibacteria bacterium]
VKEAEQSQYDLLIDMKKCGEDVPDKTLCLANTGKKFHGQRNRDWISLSGNIHLSVFLKPDKIIKQFAPGFNILAAVSVLQTIDAIDDLKEKAQVKWVNDILIDNAKVCGFLAHTLTEGSKVTGAVLGIGLNVESSPDVDPTPFVPQSSSLKDFSNNQEQTNQSFVFHKLIANLARNYRLLLENGYNELLDIYRQRSIIIGRDVIIKPDPIRPVPPVQVDEKVSEDIEGRVAFIGDNLELFLEGRKKPIFSGRLILKD